MYNKHCLIYLKNYQLFGKILLLGLKRSCIGNETDLDSFNMTGK